MKTAPGWLAATAFLTLAPRAPAQQPAPAPQRERVRVTLVQLPVTVADGDGRPILGLTASDFEVKDNGKSVRLEAVDAIEYPASQPPDAPPEAQAPAPRVSSLAAVRKFVLLFDLTFASQTELQRALQGASRFAREQMGALDAASIATVSAGGGVKILQQFSPDRARLLEVLEAETNSDAWERTRPTSDNLSRILPSDVQTTIQQDTDRYRRQLASQLLGQLEGLAGGLEAIPGRKHVLLFSHGFDPQLLTGSVSLPSGPRDLKTSPFGDTESHGDSSLRAELDRLHASYRRHDVVLYAIDLAGIASVVTETSNERIGTFARGRESLAAIAQDTGGELMTGSNDFGPLLDRVLEATRTVYLLSFPPAEAGGVGKFHPLKVKVVRRGARVFARTGYYERYERGQP